MTCNEFVTRIYFTIWENKCIYIITTTMQIKTAKNKQIQPVLLETKNVFIYLEQSNLHFTKNHISQVQKYHGKIKKAK